MSSAFSTLRDLASYRYTYTGSGGNMGSFRWDGVVITGPPMRQRSDFRTASSILRSEITIGRQGWDSYAHSPFRAEDGQPSLALPYASVFENALQYIASSVDIGPELRDGRMTRHLQIDNVPPSGSGLASPAPSSAGAAAPTTAAEREVMDVWIGGNGELIAAHLEPVIQQAPTDGLTVTFDVADLAIDHANDPQNRVQAPSDAGPPAREPPSGEVVAAVASLGGLGSYEMAVEASSQGFATSYRRVVLNRPAPAVEQAMEFRYGLGEGSILIQGDQAWTRSTGNGWSRSDLPALGLVECGFSPISGPPRDCTRKTLTDLTVLAAQPTGSFQQLDGVETVSGVLARHLRGDAGAFIDRYGLIPCTTDLWVASGDGHLVRMVMAGQGFSATVDVTRVDDPANHVDTPQP